jgi:hypothetical protein
MGHSPTGLKNLLSRFSLHRSQISNSQQLIVPPRITRSRFLDHTVIFTLPPPLPGPLQPMLLPPLEMPPRALLCLSALKSDALPLGLLGLPLCLLHFPLLLFDFLALDPLLLPYLLLSCVDVITGTSAHVGCLVWFVCVILSMAVSSNSARLSDGSCL